MQLDHVTIVAPDCDAIHALFRRYRRDARSGRGRLSASAATGFISARGRRCI